MVYSIRNTYTIGSPMNVSDLKVEVESLSLDERRQLTAFLVSLRHKELSGYRKSLATKIDDEETTRWVSFEEFDQRVSSEG